MIPLRKDSAIYYIKTSSSIIKLGIIEPCKKTIKHIISPFIKQCRHFSLSYPIDKYTFFYNSNLLELNTPLSCIPKESQIDLIELSTYPNDIPFSVFVLFRNEAELEFLVSEADLVISLKYKIQNLLSIPPDQQRIIFNGRQLEENIYLQQYNIQDQSRVILALSLRGGGCPQVFMFNNMTGQVEKKFSNNAPEWRVVDKGISWRGMCRNDQCPAFESEAIANSGYGVMDTKRISKRATCPICRRSLFDVKNCGFFKACWSFVGIDSSGFERRGDGEAKNDKYCTFIEEESGEWKSLLIEVRPLG